MTVESLDTRPGERVDRDPPPSPLPVAATTVLRDMMVAVAEMLGVERAVVRGVGVDGRENLFLVHDRRGSGLPAEFLNATLRETRVAIARSRADELPPISREMGVTASLLVPCLGDGELLAVFAFHHLDRAHQWKEEEIQLASAMSRGAAVAIERVRLHEAVQYQMEKVKRSNQFLIEAVLPRFLPASIVARVAGGELIFEVNPEPREIAVFFSDIVGFTPLSIRLGPEQVAILLNEYLETMTRAVIESGGTVDKFMGDAIFALFGAPEALCPEEQARRAIATARTMHRYLDELNRKWRGSGSIGGNVPPVRFRCGIHQGSAIVGMFGGTQRTDYTAIGPTVNIASRLQEAATANTILVSRAIARHLDPREIVKIESLKLKGIEETIVTYAVSLQVPAP